VFYSSIVDFVIGLCGLQRYQAHLWASIGKSTFFEKSTLGFENVPPQLTKKGARPVHELRRFEL
jgi:hypothetical protein